MCVGIYLKVDLHRQLNLPRPDWRHATEHPEAGIANIQSTAAVGARRAHTEERMIECVLGFEAQLHLYTFTHLGQQKLLDDRQVAGKQER